MKHLFLPLLLLHVWQAGLFVWAKADVFGGNVKALKICSISEGLNIARLCSSNTRNLFRDAIEDVEFIREYISEAATNGGIVGGLHTLQELNQTLDWQARGFLPQDTTVDAGLGYSDDRRDRRVERYVGLAGEPFVGTKESDIAMIDSASNIFPWIIDRRSMEDKWYISHQNGRSTRKQSDFERLYVAAWIGTRGEAWLYYPPLTRAYPDSQPLGFGDVLGHSYNSQEEEFVQPNLPENNPQRRSYFTSPYADTAVPGLSLITAQAPIYFTGEFQGHTYNDTYIASTGVDISVASMATLLDELEDTLTEGSFAFLVNVQDFRMVAISQSTVEKIYPQRTGMEDVRVTYDTADGSLLDDRRNQTYMVSDTIHQSPGDLQNADWKALAEQIKALSPGQRDSINLDIVLTGDDQPTSHYVMVERWADVADWALTVFAPQEKVDFAMNVQLEQDEIDLQIKEGESKIVSSTLHNRGTMDATIQLEKFPPWFSLISESHELYTIKAGESLTLEFNAGTTGIVGSASSLIAYTIADDDYPDCFFEQLLTVKISTMVLYEVDLHQLDSVRPYGFALSGVIVVSSVACSVWVVLQRKHRVVRASQPIFLHILCAGILIMGLAIVPMGIDDSIASDRGCTIACMAMPWLLSMGFSIVFAALFSKIWRINQIVKACRNYQRVNVEPQHVLVPFFCIFTANAVVLTLWTSLDPLVWTRESRGDERNAQEFNSYGSCSFQGNVASISFAAALLAINFLALVLALVELYRARNISMEYSESKYIAIALGSNLQVFLTGLPILVLVNDSPQLLYFVKSSLVFALAMAMLLLIFVPKILMIKNHAALSLQESSVPDSKPMAYAQPGSIDTKHGLAHRSMSVGPYKPSSDLGRSVLDETTMYSIAENCGQFEEQKSDRNVKVNSPVKKNERSGKSQLPLFSELTESVQPSQLELSIGWDSLAEDDLTDGSSRIWRPNLPRKSRPSAGLLQRDPANTGDSSRPAMGGRDSFENAPDKPCRVASITEDAREMLHSSATLSFANDLMSCDESDTSRIFSEVEMEKEIAKERNASKPERIHSVAEPVIEYDSCSQSNASTLPLRVIGDTDSVALRSCSSLQTNSTKPARFPSEVEPPCDASNVVKPKAIFAMRDGCAMSDNNRTHATEFSAESPV